MRRALALGLAAALAGGADAPGAPEPAPERPRVPMHGRVVLDAFSTRTGNPAAVFDHFRHRALYTCRVCHVDLGFAIAAGESGITAAGNEDGTHCGACHDGKRTHQGRVVFAACSGWPRADAARGCLRCHTGAQDDPRPAYEALARRLPVDAAGQIDWIAAERQRLIAPLDAVAGVSLRRPAMKLDRDVTIQAEGTWLGDVTFSHRRHAALNGCELCHPEVFPLTQRGAASARMDDIRAGRYCGVCHVNVAFPLEECRRCHAAWNTGRSMR